MTNSSSNHSPSRRKSPGDWRLVPLTAGLVLVTLLAVVLPEPQLALFWRIGLAIALTAGGYLWWAYRSPLETCRGRRWLRMSILHVALICAASVIVVSSVAAQKSSWDEANFRHYMSEQQSFRAVIELSQQPQKRTNQFGQTSYEAAAHVLALQHRNGVDQPVKSAWPVWLRSDQPLTYGAGTVVRGIVLAQEPPSLSRIQAFVTVRGPVEVLSEQDPDIFERLRERLLELGREHRTGFDGIDASTEHQRGSALIASMIVGDTSEHDEQLRTDMKVSGLSHLSAVSGANCALVFGVVTTLMRRLRLPMWLQMLASSVALILFILVVGFEPSVLRAGVMGLVGAIAVFAGRGRKTLPLLYVACIGLLLFDPWYVTDLAFQLSVAATWGIIVWGTALSNLFPVWVPRILAQATAVAVAATIATIPVLGPATGALPTHSVAANVLVTPLVPLITLLGTAALPFVLWLPALAKVLLYPVGWLTIGVGAVGHFSAGLPGALLPWPEGSLGYGLGMLIVLLVAISTHVLSRRSQALDRNRAEGIRTMIRIVRYGSVGNWFRFHLGRSSGWLAATIIACCCLIGLGVWLRPTGLGSNWHLAVCDVGQGDMFVMNTGADQAVVIDAGPDPQAADQCLKELGVTHVEHLFISHQHTDHYGGVEGVFRDRAVAALSVGTAEKHVQIPQLGTQPRFPRQGERFTFGGEAGTPHVTVTALTPGRKPHHTENNASLVLHVHLKHEDVSLLFTGDLEEEEFNRLQANRMIPENIDVLKVAHHGARNGSARVPQLLGPSLALISVGADNDYGHPHPEIVAALKEEQAHVVRTDELGSVWVQFTDNGFLVGQF
ncbi:ComEC/Rec2 family competence protein [Micrococcoides hystricis]|uniref:ComEC/Rec2 family competence protein n=1 Tax=Micrococcoides hystricis TaxID=1572761 RepID=A0ABV6P8W5_9MICC